MVTRFRVRTRENSLCEFDLLLSFVIPSEFEPSGVFVEADFKTARDNCAQNRIAHSFPPIAHSTERRLPCTMKVQRRR